MPQNPPAGVPRVLSRVTCDDVESATTFLCRVFGFHEDQDARYVDANGKVTLTELRVVDSRIMLGAAGNHGQASPRLAGANTQMLIVYVDDVDEHYATAVAEGATIVMEINNAAWGDRRYEVLDGEGHRWGFHQRIE